MDMDRARELVLLEAVRKLKMARLGIEDGKMTDIARGNIDVAMALLAALEGMK